MSKTLLQLPRVVVSKNMADFRRILGDISQELKDLSKLLSSDPLPCELLSNLTKSDPKTAWTLARRCRETFLTALKKHRTDVRVSGLWPNWWYLGRRAVPAGYSVLRLYLAAALLRCHLTGILDLSRDCERLREFTG